MKNILTCLLLIPLAVLVKCNENTKVKVEPTSGGVKIKCGDIYINISNDNSANTILEYQDSNTGEYECNNEKIFVKFRTCDNCIELDIVSLTGLIVGEVAATIIIGVSVFVVAKHLQTSPTTPNKKRSDKQRLVPNEITNDDPNYQPLRPRNNPNDYYDQLRRENR